VYFAAAAGPLNNAWSNATVDHSSMRRSATTNVNPARPKRLVRMMSATAHSGSAFAAASPARSSSGNSMRHVPRHVRFQPASE